MIGDKKRNALEFASDCLDSDNVLDLLSAEEVEEIGSSVVEGYQEDLGTRRAWEEQYNQWIDLAMQVMEKKTGRTGHAKRANVKYPLLTTAALQFGSRAYGQLIQGNNVVKSDTAGYDSTGEKAASAERVAKHMNYQLLKEMDGWEEGMDELCFTLPIVGCMFKKTYYDASQRKNVSELIYPKDLVVNYWARRLETSRKTHVIYLSENDVYERVADGRYLDATLQKPSEGDDPKHDQIEGQSQPGIDENMPYTILEQHLLLDLDGDGYKEPYVATVDLGSAEAVRLLPRYDEDGFESKGNRITKIKAIEYFTKFNFIPNPDGGFYGIGFGRLLTPINETVNTAINQLLDAGSWANKPCGFIGRGARVKGGSHEFEFGEFKKVMSTGEDLKKSIVTLPAPSPSPVLFQLLGLMIDAGKQLSSTTDALLGENPGQNQPAWTTQAVMEQGMKVFSSIYKRIHRSTASELGKIRVLNKQYLPEQDYFKVLDWKPPQAQPEAQPEGMAPGQELMPPTPQEQGFEEIFRTDYGDDVTDVQLYSDPNIASDAQRLVKSQVLVESIQAGVPFNGQEVAKRIAEAQDQPNPELLVGPDPQMQEMEQGMQEMQGQLQQMQQDLQNKDRDYNLKVEELALDERRLRMDEQRNETAGLLNIAKAGAAEAGIQLDQYQQHLDKIKLFVEAMQNREDSINAQNNTGAVG